MANWRLTSGGDQGICCWQLNDVRICLAVKRRHWFFKYNLFNLFIIQRSICLTLYCKIIIISNRGILWQIWRWLIYVVKYLNALKNIKNLWTFHDKLGKNKFKTTLEQLLNFPPQFEFYWTHSFHPERMIVSKGDFPCDIYSFFLFATILYKYQDYLV